MNPTRPQRSRKRRTTDDKTLELLNSFLNKKVKTTENLQTQSAGPVSRVRNRPRAPRRDIFDIPVSPERPRRQITRSSPVPPAQPLTPRRSTRLQPQPRIQYSPAPGPHEAEFADIEYRDNVEEGDSWHPSDGAGDDESSSKSGQSNNAGKDDDELIDVELFSDDAAGRHSPSPSAQMNQDLQLFSQLESIRRDADSPKRVKEVKTGAERTARSTIKVQTSSPAAAVPAPPPSVVIDNSPSRIPETPLRRRQALLRRTPHAPVEDSDGDVEMGGDERMEEDDHDAEDSAEVGAGDDTSSLYENTAVSSSSESSSLFVQQESRPPQTRSRRSESSSLFVRQESRPPRTRNRRQSGKGDVLRSGNSASVHNASQTPASPELPAPQGDLYSASPVGPSAQSVNHSNPRLGNPGSTGKASRAPVSPTLTKHQNGRRYPSSQGGRSSSHSIHEPSDSSPQPTRSRKRRQLEDSHFLQSRNPVPAQKESRAPVHSPEPQTSFRISSSPAGPSGQPLEQPSSRPTNPSTGDGTEHPEPRQVRANRTPRRTSGRPVRNPSQVRPEPKTYYPRCKQAMKYGRQQENWQILMEEAREMKAEETRPTVHEDLRDILDLVSHLQQWFIIITRRSGVSRKMLSNDVRSYHRSLDSVLREGDRILDDVYYGSVDRREPRQTQARRIFRRFESSVIPAIIELIFVLFDAYYTNPDSCPEAYDFQHKALTVLLSICSRMRSLVKEKYVKCSTHSTYLIRPLEKLIEASSSGALREPESELSDQDTEAADMSEEDEDRPRWSTQRPWTDEEGLALLDGLQRHQGQDRYILILRDFGDTLGGRTLRELREKALEVYHKGLPNIQDELETREGRNEYRWLLSIGE
ncbi:hypothetical protein BJX61DRAFT_444759 [Aspergillus egyptiacus]|nr:hypothetical protein BJX61DRAFT_444759 [Aspergillus egyptiacus]